MEAGAKGMYLPPAAAPAARSSRRLPQGARMRLQARCREAAQQVSAAVDAAGVEPADLVPVPVAALPAAPVPAPPMIAPAAAVAEEPVPVFDPPRAFTIVGARYHPRLSRLHPRQLTVRPAESSALLRLARVQTTVCRAASFDHRFSEVLVKIAHGIVKKARLDFKVANQLLIYALPFDGATAAEVRHLQF